MQHEPVTQEGVDAQGPTLDPAPPDADRVDRALVQASARAKLFGTPVAQQRLGRYVLAELLGEGGAGRVYAAHDTKLDRRVALKLVRHAGEEHDARLLREARALARLSHPNIVQVHDVGTDAFGGESLVYVAMELVDGQTLRAWLRSPRETAAVLAMFREIARGLAAAHGAGLVHRDFKPDNVLIGRDERPRIADFGLVRHHDVPRSITGDGADDSVSESITRSGAVMGTPAYMAPEQHARADVDARSDQFAFCVALFEALHGERPFRGDTLAELAANVCAGKQSKPKEPRKIPSRARRALARGLATDPAQRHPSMQALAAELDARRAGRGALVLGGVTVAAVGVFAATRGSDPCEDGSAALVGVWDEPARASLRAAIVASPGAFATKLADTTEHALDQWSAEWVASRRDACRQTLVHGQQTERMMDLRYACLAQRRNEAERVLAVIRAEPDVVPRAAQLAMALRSPASCDRIDALESGAEPPDPAIADEVLALRADLAEARAIDAGGDVERARTIATRVLDEARRLGYRPLLAEAEAAVAQAAGALGDLDTSEALGTAAFQDALASDHVEILAHAANHMVHVLGVQRRKPELAEPWLGHAAAATERIHDDGGAKIRLLQREGALRVRQDRLAEGETLLRQSCELADELYGEQSLDVQRCWLNLAVALESQKKLDEAESIARRVLEVRTSMLGDEHPDLGYVHNQLGGIANHRGDKTASIEHYREAARLFESGFGPAHPDLAAALYNLGNRLRESGDSTRAREVYERAAATYETSHGPKSQMVAMVLGAIGLTQQNDGRLDDAMTTYRRAAAIWTDITGRGVDGGVVVHNNMGNILLGQGHIAEAIAEYEAALAIAKAQLAEDHPMRTNPLAGLGDAALAQNDPARAVKWLAECVERREAIRHPETAQARYTLARALWLADREDEARAHLRVLVEDRTPSNADRAAIAEQWLASDAMPKG
jgi:tetratricopeptide (TPR) repeat protein